MQFIRFLIVGVINTGLNALLYLLFLWLGLHFALAHTLATGLSIINSFFWNKYFTFRKKGFQLNETLKFGVVVFVQYLASLATIAGSIALFGWSEQMAYLPSVMVGMSISYVGNKFWSFKGA